MGTVSRHRPVVMGQRVALRVPAARRTPSTILAQARRALTAVAGSGDIVAMSLADATPPQLLATGELSLVLAEWWPAAPDRGEQVVWRVDISKPDGRAVVLGQLRVARHIMAAPTQVIEFAQEALAAEVVGPLPPGERFTETYLVTGAETTGHVLGRPPVLSTPDLLAWLERTAQLLTLPHLADGFTTVGVGLDVRHLASAVAGETVTVEAMLVGRYRRRLSYLVQAKVGDRLVGTGRHEGHIVPHGS